MRSNCSYKRLAVFIYSFPPFCNLLRSCLKMIECCFIKRYGAISSPPYHCERSVTIPNYADVKTMSLQGTKQSHVEKRSCMVRDCFVPRNDNIVKQLLMYAHLHTFNPSLGISSNQRYNFFTNQLYRTL